MCMMARTRRNRGKHACHHHAPCSEYSWPRPRVGRTLLREREASAADTAVVFLVSPEYEHPCLAVSLPHGSLSVSRRRHELHNPADDEKKTFQTSPQISLSHIQ